MLTFLGMSKGQESKFLAVFDLLYSSSGPQKPQHKSSHKFISLSAKNKMTMFYHINKYLDFFGKELIFVTLNFFKPNMLKNDYVLLVVGKF